MENRLRHRDRPRHIALRTMPSTTEALEALLNSLAQTPDSVVTNVFLAAAYSALGRRIEAEEKGKTLLRLVPELNLETWLPGVVSYKDPAQFDRMKSWLAAAGLPE